MIASDSPVVTTENGHGSWSNERISIDRGQPQNRLLWRPIWLYGAAQTGSS